MKSLFILLAALAVFLSSGCASIVSKSSYPITINANPSSANLTIVNANNQELYSGGVPATVMLDASSGFFKKATYIMTVSAPGYNRISMPINFKIDGWYFGNLAFGGLIGMLIVDPATGAMYKPEQDIYSVSLGSDATGEATPRLEILDINKISEELRDNLTRVYP